MKFDPTKPVQTRDGHKARIICTDAIGSYPIVALVMCESGVEAVRTFTETGEFTLGTSGPGDLVNAPAVVECWVFDGAVLSLGPVGGTGGVGCQGVSPGTKSALDAAWENWHRISVNARELAQKAQAASTEARAAEVLLGRLQAQRFSPSGCRLDVPGA